MSNIEAIVAAPTAIRRSEDLPDWATRAEVAQYTGVAAQTLARWVTEGRGPRVTRFGGRSVRYARSDVLDWIDDQCKASA